MTTEKTEGQVIDEERLADQIAACGPGAKAEAKPVVAYHPDPEINEGVAADALEAEKIDIAAGMKPRRWACPQCGKSHGRGHFQAIGVHRCLHCGYVGFLHLYR
jgi:rubredoxin